MFSFKNVNFRFKKTLSPSHRFCVSMAKPSSEDFTVISHFLSNPAAFFFALSSWLSPSSVILQLSPLIPLAWVVLPVSVPISHCRTSSSSVPNQSCSVFHTQTMQSLKKGWASFHSHPGPWPQHGRSKNSPHVWFLTRQKKTDIPFYRHPPQCKIPRDLGLDLLVILMPGGGIWVSVKNSWYLLRRAIENWSQHLALWPRLLNPLRV